MLCLPWAPASSSTRAMDPGGRLFLLTLKAKVLARATWGWRWARASPCCDRGQAGGAASASLASGQAVGHAAQSMRGPAPKGQLWGAELPREARVWAKGSDLSCASERRAELTDGDEQGGESPGQGDPLGAASRAPSSSSWASSGAFPCRAPVPETAPPWPRVLPLTSFSLRHGRAGTLLASPASSAAGMPGSLLPVWVPP